MRSGNKQGDSSEIITAGCMKIVVSSLIPTVQVDLVTVGIRKPAQRLFELRTLVFI